MLAVKIYLVRTDPLDGTAQAGVVNQAPVLAFRVVGHTEAIVENLRDHYVYFLETVPQISG